VHNLRVPAWYTDDGSRLPFGRLHKAEVVLKMFAHSTPWVVFLVSGVVPFESSLIERSVVWLQRKKIDLLNQ